MNVCAYSIRQFVFAFQFVCMKLLQSIPHSVGPKGGTFSQWHELLGWFSPSPDAPHSENLSLIKKQLYLLWGHRTVKLLLSKSLTKSLKQNKKMRKNQLKLQMIGLIEFQATI